MSWTRQTAREHELPSGETVVLAPGPCVERLLREGLVPNQVAGMRLRDDGEVDVSSIDPAEAQVRRLQYEAALVCATCVRPLVAIKPPAGDDGVFPYDEIPLEDRQYIVAWAEEGSRGVAAFRREREGAADREDGAVLADAPVEPARALSEAV